MLYLIFAFLGAVIFTPLYENFPFVIGGIIGLVLAGLLSLQKRIGLLSYELEKYKNNAVNNSATKATTPSEAVVTEPEKPVLLQEAIKQKPLPDVAKIAIKEVEHKEPITPLVQDEAITNIDIPKAVPSIKKEKNKYGTLTVQPPATQYINLESPPAEKSGLEKLFNLGLHWFTDGNTFVRVGIVVLFFGFAMLFKEVYSQGLVTKYLPIELRLSFAALFAFALLYFGWRFTKKRETYGLLLQGAAIGILYLTTFAALSLYELIPPLLAFAILVLLCVFSTGLAVIQNAKSLAIFSVVGGFLAPILTSTGSNNYIGLFSFYALLNTGIFAVALKKSWRLLNLIGFVFTFSVASLWSANNGYQPEFFVTTEPFLIFFFLLYVCVTVLFAIREQLKLNNYVDSTLLFGVPVLGFGLQVLMVSDYQYGLAISAFVLGAFYIGLSYFIQKKFAEKLQLLTKAFLVLGAIFATLSIPFALDTQLSSIAWVLEGTGIVWMSIKQEQKYRRLFGLLIQLLGTGLFADALYSQMIIGMQAPVFFNGILLGAVLIMLSLFFTALLLFKNAKDIRQFEKGIGTFLLTYGVFWLFSVLLINVDFDLANPLNLHYILSGAVLALLIYTLLAKVYRWKQAAFSGFWMIAAALITVANPNFDHPAQNGGFLLWPIFFSALLYLAALLKEWLKQEQLLLLYGVISLFISGLLLWEGVWVLLLGMSILSILFAGISKKYKNQEMDTLSLTLLPVMAASMVASMALANNIVSLPSIGLPALSFDYIGAFLWPLAFAVAFALLNVNQSLKQSPYMRYAHYFIGVLIAISLLIIGNGALLLGGSILAFVFNKVGYRFNWPYLRELSQGLMPIMVGIVVFSFLDVSDLHCFELNGFEGLMTAVYENGYVLWPLSFLSFFLILKQWKDTQYTPYLLRYLLVGAIGLFVILSTWEMSWHLLDIVSVDSAWYLAALPLFAILVLWVLIKWERWPIKQYRPTLNNWVGLPLSAGLVLWAARAFLSSGDSSPLLWIPILNPLDLMQIIVIFTLFVFGQIYKDVLTDEHYKKIMLAVPMIAFIWLNIETLRAISHWVNIPWRLPDIISYSYSQTALAVLWTLLGLGLIFVSGKLQHRKMWMLGAGLLVVVTVKLFIFDFNAQNNIARIITFITVGTLFLIVGYISPLPPSKPDEEEKTK
jgi:uncharacterized membrane protein